ncbi:MAG: anti-sigma factor [Planctomycetota bacterium]
MRDEFGHESRDSRLIDQLLGQLDDDGAVMDTDLSDINDISSLELTTARMQATLAVIDDDMTPMPDDIRNRMYALNPTTAMTTSSSPMRFPFAGFVAAAACIAMVVSVFVMQSRTDTVADLRETILVSAEDACQARWLDQNDPTVTREPGGDVIWSAVERTGVLQICHVPINESAQERYHVWMETAGGDPVLLATFDVTDPSEFKLVKLSLPDEADPTGFVVTLDAPTSTAMAAGTMIVRTGSVNAIGIAAS